jgi:superfamily II DNA or RNA helicase
MNTKIANRIFIEDPTDEVIAWAKENLKFPNPEYAKKERMGFWTGRTPKELRLFEWNGDTLILPFGVCREIMPLLRAGTVYTDFRQDENIDYGGVDMGLYDYQKEACIMMVGAKYGILTAKTGSGKTQMGIALIKAFRRRALWLCHTQDLLKQSRDRALRYIDPDMIGTITEGKVNVGKGVTFATVQTVANLELTQYRDYWDVVIVDECHRVASSATSFTRYEKVLNHLAARHKIGLTATPERSDGLIKATFALIGKVVYSVPDEAVADQEMGVKIRTVETEVEMDEDLCLNPDGTLNYTKLVKYLTTHYRRSRLIADKIIENKGHSCLILSDRLDQLTYIMAMLPTDMLHECAFINGKMTSKKAKAEREQAIEDMRTGKKKYLFASYSLSKEGLDIPRLDRLYLASPAKFSSVITQAVGRVRRTFEGKETPVVYDFVDDIGYCRKAYKERCRSYRKIGAEIG